MRGDLRHPSVDGARMPRRETAYNLAATTGIAFYASRGGGRSLFGHYGASAIHNQAGIGPA